MVTAKNSKVRPKLVTLIVIVNIIGWLTTERVWVYFHLSGQIPNIDIANSYWEAAYIGLVNGFTTADPDLVKFILAVEYYWIMAHESLGLDGCHYGQYDLVILNDLYTRQRFLYRFNSWDSLLSILRCICDLLHQIFMEGTRPVLG